VFHPTDLSFLSSTTTRDAVEEKSFFFEFLRCKINPKLPRVQTKETVENLPKRSNIQTRTGYDNILMKILSLHSVVLYFFVVRSCPSTPSGLATAFVPLNSFTNNHRHHHHAVNNKSTIPTRTVSTHLDMMRLPSIKALINNAISIGAPAYNEGNIDECAQVYQAAALQVFQSNVLPQFLQTKLQQTLLMSGQQSSIDAAWAFRGQFDAILEYQEPITPITSAASSSSSSRLMDSMKQPFTTKIMFLNDPIVVNDNVMGGRSTCLWDEETKTFEGTTSLANNGGFASLRWRLKATQNWNHAKGIYIQVKSQSKPMEHTFRLLLKDGLCEQVQGANYKVTFACPTQTSQLVRDVSTTMASSLTIFNDDDDNGSSSSSPIIYIPFSAFGEMEQRGRKVMISPSPSSPPSPLYLDTSAITEIGIMAIKPTVVGDFELTIEDWGLYI